MPSISYECPIAGSEDVAGAVQRLVRSRALARAENKARSEAAALVAEAQGTGGGIGTAIKAGQRILNKLLGGLQEWAASAEDEPTATAQVLAEQVAAETRARACVLAALQETRRALESKATAANVQRWHTTETATGKRVAHEQNWQHPWHGKTVRFQPQPRLRVMTDGAGRRVVTGEWDYEVL